MLAWKKINWKVQLEGRVSVELQLRLKYTSLVNANETRVTNSWVLHLITHQIFLSPVSIHKHMQIHTDEQPSYCHLCD